MSLYRLVRLTAILALLRRYRNRLLRMLSGLAFALVTVWLYADVAAYLAAQHPTWTGLALIIKTGIVYGVLFDSIWQLRRMLQGDTGSDAASPTANAPVTTPTLDQLAEKPRLHSRRSAILESRDG